jgi:hypothetical protein
MRAERSLTGFLRRLRSGLPLLHDFVDRERLTHETLALRRLDGSAPDLGVANHHDRKALRLARLGIDSKHRVLDGHKRREQLPHMLDLDTGIKIADVDLEHGHCR